MAAKIDALIGTIPQLNCDAVISMLRSNGISAVLERTVADLQADKILDDAGLQVNWQHPNWGLMKQIAANPAVSDVSYRAGWPAPDPGSDGEEILVELGYSAQEIGALKSSGIVSDRIPLFSKA